jgi:sugar phosphate isomerase/epimerase
MDHVFSSIKSFGFDGVELAGFYGLSASELKQKLNEHQLEVVSTHESIERLSKHIDQVIADYKILGTKHIVIPYTEMKNKTSYEAMLPIIKEAVRKLTKHGYTVHYHNHANEFESFDDSFVIEHLLKDVPELRLELDVYWATFAKIDVMSFIDKYQHRIDIIHAKDMILTDNGPHFESVGKGIINFSEIYSMKNSYWIVENDRPLNDPLVNIKDSIYYIKALVGGKS